MRSLLAVSLLAAFSGCEGPDAQLERYNAFDNAIDPVRYVALAAQWYRLENGEWPTALSQIADLDDALGEVVRMPPEPVPVPDANAFETVDFEVINDSLLRVRFEMTTFQSPSREVELYSEDAPHEIIPIPAMTVSRSKGVMVVPAYREETSEAGQTEVVLADATVETESGRRYEFENESRDLQQVIFLRPLGTPR